MIIELNNFGFFKKKISLIKSILTESKFIFTKKGLYLNDVDIKNETLIYLFLDRKYFEKYESTKDSVSYKINLLYFYKCLKTISVKNKLILKFYNNHLEIIGEKNSKIQKYTITIFECSEQNMLKSYYNIDYNNVFQIQQNDINNIFCFEEFQFIQLSIKIKDKKVTLISKNEDVEIIKEVLGLKFEKHTDYSIESNYDINNIKKASRFLNILKKCSISINNKAPLKLESINENFQFKFIILNINNINS